MYAFALTAFVETEEKGLPIQIILMQIWGSGGEGKGKVDYQNAGSISIFFIDVSTKISCKTHSNTFQITENR